MVETHKHNGTDSPQIEFTDISITPEPAITAPTGGSTIDTEARTAIISLIAQMKKNGFIK